MHATMSLTAVAALQVSQEWHISDITRHDIFKVQLVSLTSQAHAGKGAWMGPSTPSGCTGLSAGTSQTGASLSWQLCQLVCSHHGCGAASFCVHLLRSVSLQVQSCTSKRVMATAVQQAPSGRTCILPLVWQSVLYRPLPQHWALLTASHAGYWVGGGGASLYMNSPGVDIGVVNTCLCFCCCLGLPSVSGAG